MKLNTKITIALILSFLLISLVLSVTYVMNLRKNQIDNINSFRNEFVEISLELLESNSNSFFQEIERETNEYNWSREDLIENIENIASEKDNVIIYDVKEKEFIGDYNNQKLTFLVNKEKIESILIDQILYKKNSFTIDNYDSFLKGNKTLIPAKIYIKIYNEYGLVIGYGKSFNSGKTRIEFIENQNKEYYKNSIIAVIIASLIVMFLVPTISIRSIKRWIVNPVLELRDRSKDIADGNFENKVKIVSRDEIGELAKSYNSMADMLKKSKEKLENYNKGLEKEVERRTNQLKNKNHELEKFNKVVVDREIKMIELKKKIDELEGKGEK